MCFCCCCCYPDCPGSKEHQIPVDGETRTICTKSLLFQFTRIVNCASKRASEFATNQWFALVTVSLCPSFPFPPNKEGNWTRHTERKKKANLFTLCRLAALFPIAQQLIVFVLTNDCALVSSRCPSKMHTHKYTQPR